MGAAKWQRQSRGKRYRRMPALSQPGTGALNRSPTPGTSAPARSHLIVTVHGRGGHMKLESGEFLGDTLKSLQTPGVHMQLRQYSAGSELPAHSHDSAYLCLVRTGGYDERYGSRNRACRPGMLTFNPAGEPHHQHIGTEQVVLFNLELDAHWTARAMFAEPWSVSGGPLVRVAENLYREFQSPDDLTPMAVEGLLLEMAVSKKRGEASARPRWMRLAVKRLDESFRRPLSVRHLAEEMRV